MGFVKSSAKSRSHTHYFVGVDSVLETPHSFRKLQKNQVISPCIGEIIAMPLVKKAAITEKVHGLYLDNQTTKLGTVDFPCVVGSGDKISALNHLCGFDAFQEISSKLSYACTDIIKRRRNPIDPSQYFSRYIDAVNCGKNFAVIENGLLSLALEVAASYFDGSRFIEEFVAKYPLPKIVINVTLQDVALKKRFSEDDENGYFEDSCYRYKSAIDALLCGTRRKGCHIITVDELDMANALAGDLSHTMKT